MKPAEKSATEFAPGGRCTSEEISSQVVSVGAELFRSSVLKNVYNTIPLAVLVLNRFRQIVFANDTALKFLGRAKLDEILGMRPGEALDCRFAHDHQLGCGTSRYCSQCGGVRAIMESLDGKHAEQECSVTTRNGATFDFLVSTAPMELGDEHYSVLSLVDKSRDKRLEVLQRVFFHDILNTLNLIWSLADEINEISIKKKCHSPEHDLLVAGCASMQEEIRDHSDLVAAENGSLAVKHSEIAVDALLEEVVRSYRRTHIAKNKNIELNCPSVQVVSDPIILKRVIGNMLKNALEASLPGQSVKVGCDVNEAGVKLWVHNPICLDSSVQIQVFKRSFSTKGPGRGLGTYSVKLLGEKYLKGSVGFSSSESDGTVFWILLPSNS